VAVALKELQYHTYALRLQPRQSINSKAPPQISVQGLLLFDGNGYACVHPHPELGDPPLSEILEMLRTDASHPLIDCALVALEEDGAARAAGISLLAGREIPRSHFPFAGNFESLATASALGFRSAKVKMSANLEADLRLLEQVQEKAPELRLRLDFNESLSKRSFQAFLQSLSAPLLAAIEFIEDPFPYHPHEWQLIESHYPVRLAKDRDTSFETLGYTYWVHKPAIEKSQKVLRFAAQNKKKLVVTHYMDHPIGMLRAAQVALHFARDAEVADCGLLPTPHFQLETEPLNLIRVADTRMEIPPGPGFGLEDYFNELNWKRLLA
jgi:O-succinylbenzoate synthase